MCVAGSEVYAGPSRWLTQTGSDGSTDGSQRVISARVVGAGAGEWRVDADADHVEAGGAGGVDQRRCGAEALHRTTPA